MPGSVEGTGGTIMDKQDLAPAPMKVVHVKERQNNLCIHAYIYINIIPA